LNGLRFNRYLFSVPPAPATSDNPLETSPTVNDFEFDVDTAITGDPTVPGRFLGAMTSRWNIGDKPNGGYVLAIAARAMANALPDHPHPFTLTAHYLRPSEPGPFVVDVDVVRTGRKLATATASLTQAGKEKIRVLATYGNHADSVGATVTAASPPELPNQSECVARVLAERDVMSEIAHRTELLLHPDTGWIKGKPSGIARISGWTRFADGREPDVLSLPFFADGFPPAVFEVMEGNIWVPTIELTVHVRSVPSPGWLRVVMQTRFLQDGYFEEDGEMWDSAGILVAQSRQLGMIFRP
jgi:acyl-CoA thioesterase